VLLRALRALVELAGSGGLDPQRHAIACALRPFARRFVRRGQAMLVTQHLVGAVQGLDGGGKRQAGHGGSLEDWDAIELLPWRASSERNLLHESRRALEAYG